MDFSFLAVAIYFALMFILIPCIIYLRHRRDERERQTDYNFQMFHSHLISENERNPTFNF